MTSGVGYGGGSSDVADLMYYFRIETKNYLTLFRGL